MSMENKNCIALAAGCLFAGAFLAVPLYQAWRDRQGRAHARSGINRDTSGPRSEKKLPKGKHPLQLYSLGTPNGQKVTILLEELELDYDAHFIHIGQEDQFGSEFTAINPNSKIPAMVDYQGPGNKPVNLFESVSIMLYLAEKTGKFLPKDPRVKAECINWLIWQVGSAPYFGQFGHFYKYYGAKRKLAYPIERYKMESKRLVDVLDKHLAGKDFVCGKEYTIADMAIFPWIRCLAVGYNAEKELDLKSYKNVQAWMDRLNKRAAVKVGLRVNGFMEEEKYKNYTSPPRK